MLIPGGMAGGVGRDASQGGMGCSAIPPNTDSSRRPVGAAPSPRSAQGGMQSRREVSRSDLRQPQAGPLESAKV